MSKDSAIEIKTLGEIPGLVTRILGGEVFVLRRGLQQLGIFDVLVDASVAGIRAAVGEETAAKVRDSGFDRIHEWVNPGQLPAVTDAVYGVMTPMAHQILGTLVPRVFPDGGGYYYERSPNVRFHIPFDRAAQHRREFSKFAEKHGEGKIAAHGPHRDQWVDCPSNAINVWIAIGPVQKGNSLTIFTKEYHKEFAFKDGYIQNGERLQKPLSFDLEPGDAVLFLSHHLHGSELNRTDRTRYVVSYRVTFGKPHYPHGHYHHYVHGGLAGGPWRALAGIPQNLQASFVRYQWRRLRYKMTGRGKMSGADSASVRKTRPQVDPLPSDGSITLTDLPVGSIRPVSKNVCVARLDQREFIAVSRFCPHSGGDLTAGWIDDGKIVCPLHSLTFDCTTGASPCSSLRPLRTFPCSVHDGRVHVLSGANDIQESELAVSAHAQG